MATLTVISKTFNSLQDELTEKKKKDLSRLIALAEDNFNVSCMMELQHKQKTFSEQDCVNRAVVIMY